MTMTISPCNELAQKWRGLAQTVLLEGPYFAPVRQLRQSLIGLATGVAQTDHGKNQPSGTTTADRNQLDAGLWKQLVVAVCELVSTRSPLSSIIVCRHRNRAAQPLRSLAVVSGTTHCRQDRSSATRARAWRGHGRIVKPHTPGRDAHDCLRSALGRLAASTISQRHSSPSTSTTQIAAARERGRARSAAEPQNRGDIHGLAPRRPGTRCLPPENRCSADCRPNRQFSRTFCKNLCLVLSGLRRERHCAGLCACAGAVPWISGNWDRAGLGLCVDSVRPRRGIQ
jgi:hypothetical protein